MQGDKTLLEVVQLVAGTGGHLVTPGLLPQGVTGQRHASSRQHGRGELEERLAVQQTQLVQVLQ